MDIRNLDKEELSYGFYHFRANLLWEPHAEPRNRKIWYEWLDGATPKELAKRHFLSVNSVRVIIRECCNYIMVCKKREEDELDKELTGRTVT